LRWLFASPACGVAHPAIAAAAPSVNPAPFPLLCFAFSRAIRARCISGSQPTFIACASGVGHPEQSLSDVRRADARSAQIGGPDGISQCFQVSAYSGEPFTSILARNLLSKDRCRAALGDEAVKSGPEVSFVGMASPLSRARKRLTGT
jgi:hypothetical protein